METAYFTKRGDRPIDGRRISINSAAMWVCASRDRNRNCVSWVTRFALAMMLALASSQLAFAEPAPVIVSQDGDYREALAPHSSVLQDYSKNITIDTLLANPDSMIPVTRRYVDFGLTDARIWLRASLVNPSQKSGVWRLDLRRQFVRALDVYVVRNSGRAQKILSHTNRDPFSARPIPNRYLAVDIPIDGQEKIDIVVAYQSDAASWLPYAIMTSEAHAVAHAHENSINWSLNGALAAVLIIALILSPVLRWQTSVAFCAYIISGSLFVFNSEGYAFQYLWPNAPGLNDPVDLIFILMMAASGPAFGRVFFDIKRHSVLLNRLLLGVIGAAILLALLTFPLFQSGLFKQIAYPLVFVSTLLQLTVAVLALKKRLPGATPFLIGAISVLGSITFAIIAHGNPGTISLERTLDVGHATLLIEAVAFATAIAIRLHLVRQDRDRALRAELRAAKEKSQMTDALAESQAQYNAARALARRRREDLSSVRHDIAQPLTSLRAAMVDLEGVDEVTTERMHASFDYLETIARHGALIDRATGDNPEKKGDRETFDVSIILNNVVAIFSGEATAKGLALRCRPLEASVETDPLELMRMVSNLVSNAIKYTSEGGVLISAHRRSGKIEIGVRDTGPGMDKDGLNLARQKHQKSAASTGEGLGLHLVAEAATRLGIGFNVFSREGRGTTALLSLAPARRAHQEWGS